MPDGVDKNGVVTEPLPLDNGQGDGAGTPPADSEATTIANQLKTIAGLDRRVSQLQMDAALAVDREAALVVERDEARANLALAATTIDEYVKRVPGLEADLATANAASSARSSEAQRAQMIATEFPALAPLLAGGFLPEFTDTETYRQTLATAAKSINLISGAQQQVKFAGATPPAAPAATGLPSRGQVLQDLHSPDIAIRERAQTQWEQLATA